MANFNLRIEAPELAKAINNLASAIKLGASCNCKPSADAIAKEMGKDVTDLSDADTVKLPNGDDPKKYTMFQDLAKIAQKLRDTDKDTYEEILYKFVPKGKKYSAIKAADWGKAIKAFKKAIEELEEQRDQEDAISNASVDEDYDEVEEDYEEEEEEPAYTVGEIRALAAKAKNAGVKVGPIMKKITGVTKVSQIDKSKYNAFANALNEAMEEV